MWLASLADTLESLPGLEEGECGTRLNGSTLHCVKLFPSSGSLDCFGALYCNKESQRGLGNAKVELAILKEVLGI